MVLICDFVKIVFVAKNISQIVTTSPTRRQSPRPSLGESLDEYSDVGYHNEPFLTALVRKLELESVLQPDLHLSGNVATERPRDLRKPDNKLHQ